MSEKTRFTVENDEGVLLEVESVEAEEKGTRLPHSEQQKRLLSQLVDVAVRTAVTSGQYLVNGDTVKLVIKPELQAALKAGTARYSTRSGTYAANVLHKSAEHGKGIAGNVRFEPAQAAKLANVAGAAWQVAAVVTAQHYMHEIDSKLSALNDGVRSISEFLNNQQNAALAAAQDTLRRDVQVYLADPTSEEDRHHLTDSIHKVFELAQENCFLRAKNMQGLIRNLETANKDETWTRAEPEAQAFLFALTVGAEALAACRIAGQSGARHNALRDSFEASAANFRGMVGELDTLYQQRLEDHRPADWGDRPRWQEALPNNLVRRVKHHRQDKQHHHWREAAERAQQGSRQLVMALDSVGQCVQGIGRAQVLTDSLNEQLPLVVVLNGSGEVEEVYLSADARDR